MGTLIIQNGAQLRDELARREKMLAAALPRHLSVTRFMETCKAAFRQNVKLFQCNPASIVQAIEQAAVLGLEIGMNALGQAYLVPFKEECTLIVGYKGLSKLARQSGEISTISMECVYRGDAFDFQLGDDPFIHHKPNDAPDASFADADITHAYCVVKLKDGGIQRKVWNRARLLAHRDRYSKAYAAAEKSYNGRPPRRDSIWHTNERVAFIKTVFRDMVNRGEIPVSVELQNLLVREESYDQDTAPTTTVHTRPDAQPPLLEEGVDEEVDYDQQDRHDDRDPWEVYVEQMDNARSTKQIDELCAAFVAQVGNADPDLTEQATRLRDERRNSIMGARRRPAKETTEKTPTQTTEAAAE